MAEKIYSITGITRRIRDTLELKFNSVWVQGEVSNHRLQNSGHQYFTLKDSGAQLSCVLFRSQARFSRTQIGDGLKLKVFGEISVYEPRGTYQLIARQVQAAGEGELQARFLALKAKLEAEGLFDPSRKRPIVRYPRTVGVITSPTGAAIRDFLNVLSRRSPWVRVLVFPVRVQGEGAHREIVRAIELANRPAAGVPALDTLVITRGGGSLEDLWEFNEESVARAIADSGIPVISAVGHEVDFTISDFAADLRAPTPSAAAEIVAPDGSELSAKLTRLASALRSHTMRGLEHREHVLELHTRSGIHRAPLRAIERGEQIVDQLGQGLRDGVESRLEELQRRVDLAGSALHRIHPETRLIAAGEQLQQLGKRLNLAAASCLNRKEERLKAVTALVKSLGPQSAFSRGFSMTTTEDGKILTGTAKLKPGDRIHTRLAKGTITSAVEQTKEP